jgi:sulfide:quinone oxidoreductase
MTRTRRHVLIAGGGVAGLETLLALRALAGDRLDITILAPELKFVNRSMSAQQPFKVQRGRGFRLEDTAAELGAHWHRGALDRVVHAQHRAVTRDRESLRYDMLVLALGARPQREWQTEGVLTYRGGRDGPNYRMLLRQLREGRIEKVAFVKPAGASWPLPLYDLALMTAAECAAHDRPDVELSLITPEEEPLAIFGIRASAAISTILSESGVTLHTRSYGQPGPPGRLDISPGHRSLAVDRVVTEPRLVGPSLRGIPSGHEGFIHTDAHGRVPGVDDVFAAGDATTFPVKQGGLAAQQADAVAEAIAALAGADVQPQPFRPVLRGVLLTGRGQAWLRKVTNGDAPDGEAQRRALFWPPTKIAGRYLSPYLNELDEARALGKAPHPSGVPVELDLERERPGALAAGAVRT